MTEATIDQTATPIYGPFPAGMTYDAIQQQILENQRMWQTGRRPPSEDRENYVQLPWCLEELAGTTWCFVHTGGFETVLNVIDYSRPWGVERIALTGMLCDTLPKQLGLWVSGRYVIDTAVRIDHLSLVEQFPWYTVAISFRNQEIARLRESLRKMDSAPHRVSCYKANRRIHIDEIRRNTAHLDSAIERLQGFASLHGMTANPDHLNVGLVGATEPAQLRLF